LSVCTSVFIQVRLALETPAANGTRERPLIRVFDLVCFQVPLRKEALAANGTRERQLARVNKYVGFQGRLTLEAIAALSALKGLDVKVHHFVFPEGSRTLELLVTHGAREWPLVSVCESMPFQGCLFHVSQLQSGQWNSCSSLCVHLWTLRCDSFLKRLLQKVQENCGSPVCVDMKRFRVVWSKRFRVVWPKRFRVVWPHS